MEQRFDFNLLRIFLEVYQQRSITLAADSLGLTQPGVSYALKRLQKTLGVELFVREGRGISPTLSAIQLANQISPAYSTVTNAINNVSGFDKQTPRSFLVHVNESMMNLLLPLTLNDDDMGNCDIQFQLTPNSEDELLQQLNLQQADLAIDIGQLPSQSYNSQFLYQEEAALICREDHPRIQDSITKQQFYQEKHITSKLRREDLTVLEYISDEVMSERKVSCECSSLVSLMGLISESDCIGITSTSLAAKYANKLGLKSLTPPIKSKPVVHNMFWHKRNEHHPAHIWLRSKLTSLVMDPQ
ncbi:LysR family transcriptional regulator [Vibrio genomosp. F10]|uniref:LysR family transcriptional regulator n=2 Tax=Vibrio genomosp. F10 TaxID=723171 RepID=A0A1B9QVK7_9VIBR|nr:LysR family transcriptional regulator [Vibrio genomosp. F10]OCH73045.1 LysR family transcriptional regulator [Vibrio genomosp. F10]OEE30784.1 LysR family transcriptional regulator [Vibrio genomosp. F10 str. ZF-129]OEE92731.1 LysR family transcriptional regulator [Vibrio genomosp. F10 str. 9ZC157]OEF01276.1 LysR family transcriptional regulator [Vibrio genomosp. F10 str. 9ZD137]OEF05405.1 LysR family transcriptional regulator [Vibrio genomosp. F10 str. 9ZB36]